MGEEQRGTWQEMLAASEEAYESGTDLTLAVEEEFALLDPDGLGLVNRASRRSRRRRSARRSSRTSSAS